MEITDWPRNTYKQPVTYWKKIDQDNYGNSIFDPPLCFKGRWEEKAILFIDAAGEEQKSDSVVWVYCDVTEGDYLFNGNSQTLDPTEVQDAREIRGVERKSNWEGDKWTEIRAML